MAYTGTASELESPAALQLSADAWRVCEWCFAFTTRELRQIAPF